MKKALLVLGGGIDQVFMIKTTKEMGYLTVCVDGNPDAPGLKLSDHSKVISYTEVNDIINYCLNLLKQGINLSGVTTMGSDIPHIISQIASFFKWIGPSTETGQWTTNKFKMKSRLKEKNIPIPRFGLVETKNDIHKLRETWDANDVIIKPTDRSGSRGVYLISQYQDLDIAFNYVKKYSLNNQIILEEYVPGLQISTETIIHEGKSITAGFAERVYSDTKGLYPNILENGGWLPSNVTKNIHKKVCTLVEDAARALKIDNGVAKGDVVICKKRGPLIIEMAARLSGGDFSESLIPLSTGINYVRTAIQVALGEKNINLALLKSSSHDFVANRYFFVRPGIFEGISGLNLFLHDPEVKKLELNYKIGSQLPIIDSHATRTGVFIIKAKNKKLVEAKIRQIYETVKFKIDGVWVSGHPNDYSPKIF